MHHSGIIIYVIGAWAVGVVIVFLVFQFAGPRGR
jgi:hypothetical protein